MHWAAKLAIRLAIGLVGGYFLMWAFFREGGILVALILAGIVVTAAYASEAWRKKNG